MRYECCTLLYNTQVLGIWKGTAIGCGIGGLIGRLLADDDSGPAISCDIPAKLTHWQCMEDSWACMVTVSLLPEWFTQCYLNKKMVITAVPTNPASGEYLKSKKEKDGKIGDAVLPALLYTVQKDASYSVFLPYAETNTDNLMDELFDFESDQWGNEYDELIETVFHIKDTESSEDKFRRFYLETCFFDGIPADYEIAAALDTSEDVEREEIFEGVFQFYSFMHSTVKSIVSNSSVISDIADSLGISKESYYRIAGVKSKEKQPRGDRTLISEKMRDVYLKKHKDVCSKQYRNRNKE